MKTMIILDREHHRRPMMEDGHMDEARIITLAAELKTLYDQLRKSPPDEPDLLLPRTVR